MDAPLKIIQSSCSEQTVIQYQITLTLDFVEPHLDFYSYLLIYSNLHEKKSYFITLQF